MARPLSTNRTECFGQPIRFAKGAFHWWQLQFRALESGQRRLICSGILAREILSACGFLQARRRDLLSRRQASGRRHDFAWHLCPFVFIAGPLSGEDLSRTVEQALLALVLCLASQKARLLTFELAQLTLNCRFRWVGTRE